MERAVVFARVSSKEQEEGYSLEAQVRLAEEYAKKNALQIVRTWKAAESAWRPDGRDHYDEMLRYVKKHCDVRHILFHAQDRIARNLEDSLKIYRFAIHAGVTIHITSINTKYGATGNSMEKLFYTSFSVMAEIESDRISQRTKTGMEQKARNGRFPSRAPIGYVNDPLTGTISPDPERAEHIRKAFTCYAAGGISAKALWRQFRAEGFRMRSGTPCTFQTFCNILDNPLYYGAFKWNGVMYDGTHEPIISKSLFDRVQALRHDKYHHPVESKNNNPFNNLLTCGECSCKVLGERKKGKYTYYHCTFSKGRHQPPLYVQEDDLAQRLAEAVQRIYIEPKVVEWLGKAVMKRHKHSQSGKQTKLRGLRLSCGNIKIQLDQLLELRMRNEIDGETYSRKQAELKSRQHSLEEQIRLGTAENPDFEQDLKRTLELCNRLPEMYMRVSHHEKAKLLKILASNYTLNRTSIDATYRKPFDLIAEGVPCQNWLPEIVDIDDTISSLPVPSGTLTNH